MLMSAFVLGVMVASSPVEAADPASFEGVEWPNNLAVAPLQARRNQEAVTLLEKSRKADPDDPAVLINLGIAYAQMGEDQRAHALFTEALSKRTEYDLAIAEGRVTDSRQLARRALRMLERGEFRSAVQPAGQLTLRD